jgi:predicted dehydrogenase
MSKNTRSKIGRRQFVSTTTAGIVGAGAALGAAQQSGASTTSSSSSVSSASSASRVQGANERVRVALIGAGRQGIGVMRNHQRLNDVDVVAVCDVYKPNLDKASAAAPKAERVTDFRRILDDKSIDAVILGTPDHWHALQTVMACAAGKDVYVEKPTSVAIAEGRAMVDAARKHQRIVQVGTQQRSAAHFKQAVEVVKEGKIGVVTSVRCWNVGNAAPEGIGNPPDSEPPAELDWDMWLGPAPKVAFNKNRFGVHPEGFSHFRWFWDYAGGMMTDWGVHLIDIVQWAMNVDAPLAVSAVGGKFHLTDNRETPDTILATYQYPGFVMSYENRVCNGHRLNDHDYGIYFYGTDGTLFVDREGYRLEPELRSREKQKQPPELRAFPAGMRSTTPDNPTHARNFIDCVKSRQAPICDIEIGHRSSSTAILGNLALRSGASVTWDGRTEKVTNGNRKAADLLSLAYRKPWELKV